MATPPAHIAHVTLSVAKYLLREVADPGKPSLARECSKFLFFTRRIYLIPASQRARIARCVRKQALSPLLICPLLVNSMRCVLLKQSHRAKPALLAIPRATHTHTHAAAAAFVRRKRRASKLTKAVNSFRATSTSKHRGVDISTTRCWRHIQIKHTTTTTTTTRQQ